MSSYVWLVLCNDQGVRQIGRTSAMSEGVFFLTNCGHVS